MSLPADAKISRLQSVRDDDNNLPDISPVEELTDKAGFQFSSSQSLLSGYSIGDRCTVKGNCHVINTKFCTSCNTLRSR